MASNGVNAIAISGLWFASKPQNLNNYDYLASKKKGTFVDIGFLLVQLLRSRFIRVGLDTQSLLYREDFEKER